MTNVILLLTVEFTLLFGALMSFVPMDQRAMLAQVFDKDMHITKKDWKMFVYHAAIGLAIVAAILLATRFRKIKSSALFVTMSAAFVFLEIFAIVFILKSPQPTWAWHLLGLVGISSVLGKIFYPEIAMMLRRSALHQKGIITAAVMAVVVFLWLRAPAYAVGYFCIWSVVLACVLSLIKIKPNISFKMPVFVAPWVDFLVWMSSKPMLATIGFVGGGLWIVSLLMIVDPLAVLAKTAFGEHYYHFDFMLMAGAYASSVGNVLGVDQNVFYGLGMPMLVAGIAKIFGAVNYLSIFNVYWWLSCLYYVAFYICLRLWLGSVLLALAATILAIKWQVFYALSYPVSAIYPNGSPLRCFWDIPILLLIFSHIKQGKSAYVFAAAAAIGGAIFFMPTTGIDLMVGFIAYILAIRFIPSVRSTPSVPLWIMGIPVIAAFFVFWLFCGQAVLSVGFWKDLMYYPSLFTNGFYDVWFWDSLVHGKYWEFVVGCFIPVVYLGTFIWIIMRLFAGRGVKEDLITLIVCAYGLNLYHHYLVLSLENNYFMRAIPFVWVIFFWVKLWMEKITSTRTRALTAWALAAGSAIMLLTNHLYVAFPNIWNMQTYRNPMVDRRVAYGLPEDGRPYFFHQDAWAQEFDKLKTNSLGTTEERIFFEWQVPDHDNLKALYNQEFNFKEDATLIQSLTKPKDKVALLSSFEIEMLIQAERRPFFFYFPIISSRGLNIRTFPHTNIYTRQMLQRTIQDLEQTKPMYIFMEKIFLNQTLPPSYARDHEEILGIINYILREYHPYKEGRYLVAMQRNKQG